MSKLKKEILGKIDSDKVVVGVVGLGYVGLPLAVSFAKAKINVIGFEKSKQKVHKLNSKVNYINDVLDSDLIEVVNNRKFQATLDFERIKECDVVLICVPTPLDKFKKPDVSYIQNSCVAIGQFMKPGTFVCLESTTYPTTTEEFMLPILEEFSGLIESVDFWLGYSPERVDPGNKVFNTKNTPKVLGAISSDGLEIGKAIYSKAIDNIYEVSSPRVAEMVKILENTYRLVNISLINELALLSGKMGINIWEVIEAAKTKPFGFQAFYPGPGIGGHCIPLDPFYLEYIAKKFDFDLTLINSAGHINMRMPHYMVIKISTALNSQKKPINGSKILFLGVAYKANVEDSRESPALSIMDIITKKGGEVSYHDPYIDMVKTPLGKSLSSVNLTKEIIQSVDCVVISTKHKDWSVDFITENANLIVDLHNVISESSENIYKL